MAGVPDQPIAAEIERRVQRQAELDHAQVRSEMGRAIGDDIDRALAHFRRQLLQLRQRQALQIGGGFNRRKQVVHH